MKRVALYIRVSSEQQAKHGDSLREQQDTLEEYVKSQKDMITHSIYIDDGISGQKLERDEFTRLLNDVKAGLIDMILFTKLDRWFRSLKHYLNIQDILAKYDVHWIAVSQPYYDTTTAYGRTFINQVMSFAELEAQMTSERMMSVFANKVKMGEVISGSTPFGYSIVEKHLVPNEDAPIAKAIFEYYNNNANLNQTTYFLVNEYGIERTSQSIREMLKNEKYIGKFRDNDKYCEPIVSTDLFESVNRQLKMNQKSNTKYDYLFSGLLICGECGRKMNSGKKATWGNRRKDGTRTLYPAKSIYNCRYAYQHPKCGNTKTIREHVLEKYLLDNIEGLLSDMIVELSREKSTADDTSRKRANIENKLKRLKAAYLNEVISLDEYKKDRESLMNELSGISQPILEDKEEKIKRYTEILNMNILEHYSYLDLKERKAFWRTLIESITFNKAREIKVNFL